MMISLLFKTRGLTPQWYPSSKPLVFAPGLGCQEKALCLAEPMLMESIAESITESRMESTMESRMESTMSKVSLMESMMFRFFIFHTLSGVLFSKTISCVHLFYI